ncbi:hypothetical protein CsSME_00047776 [Camellia sinensis var. sinensis]
MSAVVVEIEGQQLTNDLDNLSVQEQRVMQSTGGEGQQVSCENHHGICAICLNKIVLQETALVKGCEHAYWFV